MYEFININFEDIFIVYAVVILSSILIYKIPHLILTALRGGKDER